MIIYEIINPNNKIAYIWSNTLKTYIYQVKIKKLYKNCGFN